MTLAFNYDDAFWSPPVYWRKERRSLSPFPQGPCFVGNVVVQFLRETNKADRIVRTVEGFTQIDSELRELWVPPGSIANGASIPRILWTVYGSPFVGDYRISAVVHDVHCALKVFSPYVVNRAFFEGMIVDQVRIGKARNMYRAVKWFGPKWEGGSSEAGIRLPVLT